MRPRALWAACARPSPLSPVRAAARARSADGRSVPALVARAPQTPGGFDNGDIAAVITRVATEILDELDYELEAKNGARFERSLQFLGFVTTPVVLTQYSTKKVLVTEVCTRAAPHRTSARSPPAVPLRHEFGS